MVTRALFALMLGLFCGKAWAQAVVGPKLPTTQKMTLEQCLNYALENNPNVRNARHEIEKSRGLSIAARATLYPHMSVNGELSQSHDDLFKQDLNPTNDGFYQFWSLQFRVTRSLYSGGANRETITLASLNNDISFIQLQETMDSVLSNVKIAFYQVLLRQLQISTSRENLRLLTTERDRQKNLFEAGRSTRFNVLRIDVQRANEEPQLLTLETGLISAQSELAQLLNIAWQPGVGGPPFELIGTMDCPSIEANVESLIALARERSPTIKRLGLEVNVAEHRLELEKASNRPHLDAFAGFNLKQDNPRPSFLENKTDFGLGLLGSWDIFDGFASRGRGKALSAGIAQSRITRDAQFIAVDSLVRRSFYTMREARLTIESQVTNVKRAVESLELARVSVESGYATVLDVLQATVDLNRARNLENEARNRYLVSLANLELALSMPVQDWGQPKDTIGPRLSPGGRLSVPDSPEKSAEPPLIGPRRPAATAEPQT